MICREQCLRLPGGNLRPAQEAIRRRTPTQAAEERVRPAPGCPQGHLRARRQGLRAAAEGGQVGALRTCHREQVQAAHWNAQVVRHAVRQGRVQAEAQDVQGDRQVSSRKAGSQGSHPYFRRPVRTRLEAGRQEAGAVVGAESRQGRSVRSLRGT